jgi:uncharacterized protein YukE
MSREGGGVSTMIGADVAELRALAADFDSKASVLRTMESQLTWRIHSSPWHGADVSRFQHDWNSNHRRAITSTAATITEAARVLRANADQQELASAANFTGRVPSVGKFMSPPPGVVGRGDAAAGGRDESWIQHALKAVGTTVGIADAVVGSGELVEYIKDVKVAGFIQKAGEPLGMLGKVGAWLGPVGAIFDIAEMHEDAQAGDGWGMALSGSSAALGTLAWGATMFAAIGVGGVVMATAAPILGAAALVVGIGSLVYHEREAIGKAAGAVGAAVAKAGEWAAGKALDLGHAAVQVGGNAIRAGTEAVKDAGAVVGGITTSVVNAGKNFVDGIFRKPAWAPW